MKKIRRQFPSAKAEISVPEPDIIRSSEKAALAIVGVLCRDKEKGSPTIEAKAGQVVDEANSLNLTLNTSNGASVA